MSNLVNIDSYFKGVLTPEETRVFEQKLIDDPAFAEEVAFYCSAMQVIKEELAEEKKMQFRKIYDESKSGINNSKPALIKKLWSFAAAAAIVAALIFSWYIFSKPSSPEQLANQYIKQHFQTEMGVKMAGKEDSLDAAIRLYNEDKLPEALKQFNKLIQADSIADIPKRMAGIVSLRLGDYDKAIYYFTQLENLSLYANPGKLYHSIALIKRNRPGDKQIAKELLQQIIDKDLEGKETAQKWIRSF
jgi:tetratricopeptide (TPR) repeat protein